jgi:pimeloyl-ACP methyl ester carboxylesterase
MPVAAVNGLSIAYDEAGAGAPLVFCHEYAGSRESWQPQLSFFARRYRCIAYNHRGYPPSSVPDDPADYSEEHLVEDLRGLLDALGIERAHLCGLSMGGALVIKFALAYPDRCLGIVSAGTGSGSTNRAAWEREIPQTVQRFLANGIEDVASFYTRSASRLPLLRKDPLGWQRFYDLFLTHSARGMAYTMQGVQLRRPTIFDIADQLPRIDAPVLLVVGDEDEACIEPSLLMKRRIPRAGLAMLANSGHAVNREEPAAFNHLVLDFLTSVEQGNWPKHGALAP